MINNVNFADNITLVSARLAEKYERKTQQKPGKWIGNIRKTLIQVINGTENKHFLSM